MSVDRGVSAPFFSYEFSRRERDMLCYERRDRKFNEATRRSVEDAARTSAIPERVGLAGGRDSRHRLWPGLSRCVMSNPRFSVDCSRSKSTHNTSTLGPKREYKFTSIPTICTGFKLATLTLRFRRFSSWVVASCYCPLIDQVGTNTVIRQASGLRMEQNVHVLRAEPDM